MSKTEATRPVCKLTECQGKPRCRMCLAMDARYTAPPAESERIAALEAERDDFHMKYRAKCDEETKAQAMRIASLEAENAALRADAERWRYVVTHAESERIAALEAERDDFHMKYRAKCDEETKAQAMRIASLEAENAALRADAERWRYVVTHASWYRHDDGRDRYSRMCVRLPYEADQSCVATRTAAIDAARNKT